MPAMFAAFWLWALAGLDPVLSLPVVTLLLAAAGVLTHLGIIRRLLKAPMLAQVCGTFGLGIALRAGAQFLWTPDFRTIADPLIAGRVQIGPIFISLSRAASACCLSPRSGGLSRAPRRVWACRQPRRIGRQRR